MMSRSLLFLGAISLYGATTVSGAGLRKALQQEEELTCLLSTLHTTYMGNDEQKSHGEETICALVQDGVPTPIAYPIVLPSEFLEQHESNIERGRLLVSIRGASLVAGEYVLEDDHVSEITVVDENFSPKSSPGRKLLEAKDPTDAFGQRRLIVFRVNGVAGEQMVVNSVQELYDAMFADGVSVKTQYEKCSEDQFTWISEGVHEVYLPKAIDSYTSPLDARNAAYLEISKSATYKASYGNRPVEDVAHNMMFVMPPCSYTGQKVALCADATNKCQTSPGSATCTAAQDKCNNWQPKGFIANAQSGGALSTFSDKWGGDLSTVVHELGHNLGQGHAGRAGNAYGDSSSNMGGGGNLASPAGPKKCFNAAQHVQFGWYKDNTLNFNPSTDAARMVKLASFVDVRKAGAANVEPVIIKIGKYNIQYNQAKDYNDGAGFPNTITIVTDMDATGVTWVQAELSAAAPQYTFSEGGKTVYVNYCAAVAGSSTIPDAVYVGIGLGKSACTSIPTGPSPAPPAPAPAPAPGGQPLCENKPRRVVRHGNNQKTRCANVTASICTRDALTKKFKPTGQKIFNVCQQQCASQAQCKAV